MRAVNAPTFPENGPEPNRVAGSRRTREAIAAPANLDYLEFGRMLSQLCPELTADSFQAKVCDEEYLERRFRFQAHVVQIKRDSRLVTFALQSFGQLHCVAMATVTPDTLSKLRENKPCILTATLISVRFSSNVTNINGVTGHLCLLEFGNATGIGPDPAYRAQKKPKPAKAAKSEPYFSPFSNFQENPPVTAAIGFTFENSVKLAFAPLALLNKALGGSKENKDHSSSYNQRPNP